MASKSPRAAVLCVSALIVLVACSSCDSRPAGSGPGPGSTRPSAGSSRSPSRALTPRRALLAAAAQAHKLRSATETLTIHDSGVRNLTETGTFQIQLKPTLELSETLTVEAAGKSTLLGGIITGTAFYLHEAALASKIGKPWLKIRLSALHNGPLAALAPLFRSIQNNNFLNESQLFAAVRDLRVVGKDTVAGVPTTEYAGSFQATELSRTLAPSLRKALAAGLRALGNSTVRCHVWIDNQHNTRKSIEVETINGDTIQTTVTFARFNQPIQITFPPASQTFTPPGE